MKKYLALGIWLLALGCQTAEAQHLLTIDSCRAMALRNNKQVGVSQVKQEVAANLRKSARTKYLPHVSALGTYQYTSEAISLLNDHQKTTLSSMGTTAASALGGLAGELPPALQGAMAGMAGTLNGIGQEIVNSLETDTRHLFAGTVMLTQPVFMGGGIVALNRLADLNEEMMGNSAEASRQAVIYLTDQTYWQVVSLKHKKHLAESYLALVKKFDHDVQCMIEEGVATRSEGLSVSVKVNEAEMTLQKVDNGLALSKMLLCQMIGLPMDDDITLAEEDAEQLAEVILLPQHDVHLAIDNRPELRMLGNSVDMSRQVTNMLKAANLPQVALTGGYAVSNPNLQNGFQKKFGGFWNVGLLVRVPLWNWGDVAYKVRASKGATAIANLELDEAREKVELQVQQNTFKVDEANKRLLMAQKAIAQADENLRMANLGFSEGVVAPTVVMEAQTAWLQAQSQLIDAQIDVRLSHVELQKSLGGL